MVATVGAGFLTPAHPRTDKKINKKGNKEVEQQLNWVNLIIGRVLRSWQRKMK
jgi:hypothetical protein